MKSESEIADRLKDVREIYKKTKNPLTIARIIELNWVLEEKGNEEG